MVERPGGKFDVGGVLYDKVRLVMVLDGYTAPVTAGTIVDLVQRGESPKVCAFAGKFRKIFCFRRKRQAIYCVVLAMIHP